MSSGQINRQIGNPADNRVDCPANTEVVNVAGADGAEAEPAVVVEIGLSVDRPADAHVNGVLRHQQVLLERAPEDGAVGRRRVEVGVPGIQVGVEVHERHLAVLAYDRAQHRQRDCVITTHRDDRAVAAQQFARVQGDLRHRVIDRERGNRHISRVDDLDLAEWGAVQLDVVSWPQVP